MVFQIRQSIPPTPRPRARAEHHPLHLWRELPTPVVTGGLNEGKGPEALAWLWACTRGASMRHARAAVRFVASGVDLSASIVVTTVGGTEVRWTLTQRAVADARASVHGGGYEQWLG